MAYVTQPDGRLMVGPGMPPIGGRYRFLAELSEGISAQVILAEDTWKPDRPHVAIKILRTMYADAGMMEARMLRFLQLHGPSDLGYIVQLYGCYKFEGHVCLVMERLHGTLLDLLFVRSSSFAVFGGQQSLGVVGSKYRQMHWRVA